MWKGMVWVEPQFGGFVTTAHRPPNFPHDFLLSIGLPALQNSWCPAFSLGSFSNLLFPHPPYTTCICSFSMNLWFDLLPWFTFDSKCHFFSSLHLLCVMRFFLPFLYFSLLGFMFSPASVADPDEEKHQQRECPSQGCLPRRRPGEEGLWHRHVETQWETDLEEALPSLQGSL